MKSFKCLIAEKLNCPATSLNGDGGVVQAWCYLQNASL